MKTVTRLREKFAYLKSLWLRPLPTETHKKIWSHFERLLNLKANVCVIVNLFLYVYDKSLGQSHSDKALRMISTGSKNASINVRNAEAVL